MNLSMQNISDFFSWIQENLPTNIRKIVCNSTKIKNNVVSLQFVVFRGKSGSYIIHTFRDQKNIDKDKITKIIFSECE